MGLVVPCYRDDVDNLPDGLTWGKAFKDKDTFVSYATAYLINVTTVGWEDIYKLVSNRYWARTFKVQNMHQIMTRIQMIWNHSLDRYNKLKTIKSKDIDELLISVSELNRSYNNSGDIDAVGESVDYLQGTGRTTTQSNDYIALMRKLDATLPNEMIMVVKDFAPLFDAFQNLNKNSATENWNNQ